MRQWSWPNACPVITIYKDETIRFPILQLLQNTNAGSQLAIAKAIARITASVSLFVRRIILLAAS